MKNLFLTFLFFSFHCFCFPQNPKIGVEIHTDSLSAEEFAIAKEGYAKMIASETYSKYQSYGLQMVSKLKGDTPRKDWTFMLTDESFLEWISSNLASTKFKSVEEAVSLRNQIMELFDRIETDYADIISLTSRASDKQALEIMEPGRLTSRNFHY